MNKNDNIKYYQLSTIYGPLYIFEDSEKNEMREFFTLERVRMSYCDLCFYEISNLENESKFLRVIRNKEGEVVENYCEEISPYEFLLNVGIYIDDNQKLTKKIEEVYNIITYNAFDIPCNQFMDEEKNIDEQKKKIVQKIIKRYLK